MVKCAIERALSLKYLDKNDSLVIISDNRNISNIYKKSLEEYLITEFILRKDIFTSISHKYVDSKSNWGVQLSDFLSFKNNRLIINCKKCKKNLPKQFREIH